MNKQDVVRLVRELAETIDAMSDDDWAACPSSPDGECQGRAMPSADGFIREIRCAYCKDTLWKTNKRETEPPRAA